MSWQVVRQKHIFKNTWTLCDEHYYLTYGNYN